MGTQSRSVRTACLALRVTRDGDAPGEIVPLANYTRGGEWMPPFQLQFLGGVITLPARSASVHHRCAPGISHSTAGLRIPLWPLSDLTTALLELRGPEWGTRFPRGQRAEILFKSDPASSQLVAGTQPEPPEVAPGSPSLARAGRKISRFRGTNARGP